MNYEYWKQFAVNQNGQNIRLKNGLGLSGEIIEEIERLIEQESDGIKLDSLKFIRTNINTIYDKFESALETNQKLKTIVQDDYQESFKKFEISNYEIINVEKLECNNRNLAEIEVLFKANNRTFLVRDYFTLNKDYEFRLCELFISAGLKNKRIPYQMNWDQLKGRKGKCLTMKITDDNYIISRYLEPRVNND